jgi:hypothetical protein
VFVIELCNILHKYQYDDTNRDNDIALGLVTKRRDRDHSDAVYEDEHAWEKPVILMIMCIFLLRHL